MMWNSIVANFTPKQHGLPGISYGFGFLPLKLPEARILPFGYDSIIAFETSIVGVWGQARNLLNRLTSKREDVQKRPNSYVCSAQLGGVIVE